MTDEQTPSQKHDVDGNIVKHHNGICPVVELAHKRFGQELGEHILWEETCFPMSDDIAMNQLIYIITKVDCGDAPTLEGWQELR